MTLTHSLPPPGPALPRRDGNPIRGVLSALKEKVPPTPLKVFEVQVDKEENIFVQITV